MAMMVHPNCWIGCCHPPVHGAVRQREKRETSAWRDEHGYEDDADVNLGCVIDGLRCMCHDPVCETPEGPWWRTSGTAKNNPE